MNAGEMLKAAADVYLAKNTEYGNNYKSFGHIMSRIFPDGLSLRTDDDFNRAGVFFHIVDKIARYAQNFSKGGHDDSLLDTSVYASMLREVDKEIQEGMLQAKDYKDDDILF